MLPVLSSTSYSRWHVAARAFAIALGRRRRCAAVAALAMIGFAYSNGCLRVAAPLLGCREAPQSARVGLLLGHQPARLRAGSAHDAEFRWAQLVHAVGLSCIEHTVHDALVGGFQG